MSIAYQNEFAAALSKAQQIGPEALPNAELLEFCRKASGYFKSHFLIEARPFFRELWRRIEAHQIPGVWTKTEACRRIRCSLRWAEEIVAGTAKDSNKHEAKAMRTGCEVSSRSKAMTDLDYVTAIARYADRTLEAVKGQDWNRFREICRLLQESFQLAAEGCQ
jgi:hypothetical protein